MPRIEIPNVGIIDFPDSMSDADIALAIETDILKTTPKDNRSFVSKGLDWLSSKDKEFADEEAKSLEAVADKRAKQNISNATQSNTGFSYDNSEELLPSIRKDKIQADRIKQISSDIDAGASSQSAATRAINDESNRVQQERVKTGNDIYMQGQNARLQLAKDAATNGQIGLDEVGDARRQFARDNPNAASAMSFAPRVVSGLANAGQAIFNEGASGAAALSGGDYEKEFAGKTLISDRFASIRKFAEDYTPEVSKESVTEALGNGELLKAANIISTNTISNADNLAALAVGFTNPALAAAIIGQMVTRNAGDTYVQNVEKGMPQQQAFINAVAKGTAEYAWERAGLDVITSATKKVMFSKALEKQLGEKIAKFVGIGAVGVAGAGVESLEELGTSYTGRVTDRATGEFLDGKLGEQMRDATANPLDRLVREDYDAAVLGGAIGSLGGASQAYSANKDRNVERAYEGEVDAAEQAKQNALNAWNNNGLIRQKQANADIALQNITNENNSVDDSISLAQASLDTTLTQPTGLLATEAIRADDILGGDNVSPIDAVTELAANTSEITSDNLQGSMADLSVQPDGGGVGGVTAAPTPSIGENVPAGTTDTGINAVDRPFASATDDFLPKMRGMTTDASIIEKIDAELARRGLAAPKAEVSGQLKAGDTVTINGDKDGKVHTVESIGDDGYVYLKSGAANTADKFTLATSTPDQNNGFGGNGDFKNGATTPSFKDNVEAWKNKDSQVNYAVVPESTIQKVQSDFGMNKTGRSLAVSAKAIGSKDGMVNFGKDALHGNYQLSDLNTNVKFDGNGNWKTTDGNKSGTYDVSNVEGETGRVISELLNKSNVDKTPTTQQSYYETPAGLESEISRIKGKLEQDAKGDIDLGSKRDTFKKSLSELESKLNNLTKPKKPKAVKHKSLLSTLKELGGISLLDKNDVTRNGTGFAAGGYNQVFKSKSKRSLKGIIESGDVDDYLPYNMRLSAQTQDSEAFDSTPAYDYLADKIQMGESVLPYDVQEELDAQLYQERQEANREESLVADDEDIFETGATLLTDYDFERLLNGTTTNEAREDNQVSNEAFTESTQGSIAGNEGTQETTATNTSEQAQDLLGDNTTAKQALADAERAKDAQRNTGKDNAADFTLTGSNSEADQAAAAGAQSLFDAPVKKSETKTTYINDRVVGKNDSGQQLFEKPDGVRYYKEDGIKINEAVSLAPDGSYKPSRNRDSFLTDEERAAKNQDKSGTSLSELKQLRKELSDKIQAQGTVTNARDEERLKQVNQAISEAENNSYDNEDKKKAQDDLDAALGDLGDIFGKSYRASITQEQEQKLIPVLAKVFDAAFRLGYYEFKAAAKFVIETIRNKIGTDVAETINLDQLQGAYISMAGKYGDKATNKRDVVNVDSIKEILEDNQNAGTNQTEQVQSGRAQDDLLTEQSRDSNSKPMDARVGGTSETTNADRNVSSGVSETSRNGTPSVSGSNRNESPSGSRKTSNDGNKPSATNAVNDFEITDETGVGEGSLAQKYKDNISVIKLIKTLESENRIATPEERNLLAKYSGWGALSKAFEKGNKNYDELKALLTDEEYAAAKASILNAYFTSPTIVKAMYDAVQHLGFKHGRVLEPSMGSGNFFGMMPAAMRNKSKLNGVELDIITSRIAKYLYPNANVAVATGFEKYQAPQGYFDLVVSNPPFGSEKIVDNDRSDYSGFSIHNYFVAKSIDKLRDDGILAVVVTHGFMDASDSKAREWISKRAILRGAVRLPNTAFKDNAGTEVITDILFFQKTNMPESNPDWVNSSDHGDYFFNDYFSANPMNVLGRVDDITSQYGKTYTVAPTGDTAKLIKEFIATRLPANVYIEPENRVEVLDSADNTIPDGVKVGTFYKDDKGVIRQRMPDMLGAKRSAAWEVPNSKAQDRMLGMMALRDLLRTQMRLERDGMSTEKQIEGNRKLLNSKYDSFLKEYGYLNSMTNRRLFLDDTESALLQAIEMDYDQGVTAAKALTTGMDKKEPSAKKADILTRRVLFPPSDSITVSNAKDALLASLNVNGNVDVDYMADVYSKSKDEIISELGDVVYNDPIKGYVTADDYLSGDVKTKLAEAKNAVKNNSEFARNVEALEKVIPKDKMPSEIYASAGANWIPADVYEEFASEITGIPKKNIEFTYVNAAAMWLNEKSSGGDMGKMTAEYGTQEINSYDLFGMVVNGKSAEVKKFSHYEGKNRVYVTDIEKTEAARAKYEKIKETWNSWIFKDADRADRLASIYNEKHNRVVARKYDGSHMKFYGMSPAVTLRPHQSDVVWRAIQDRNVLLDHVVGAGKTMAMASIAMEMKRLGIARKPMFVVPNHLTLQWRSEFTKLYPASNILAATPDDFAKDKREKMFSKMVTGDYDAIIIGHSSLKKVGLPADVEEKMYAEQVKEIADAIEEAKKARGDRGITRDMENIKKNLEAKIAKLKEKAGVQDKVVTFDELGIDALFVDEMHEFKNLFFTTQMQRTAGLGNPAGSGKALDLFMKVKFMQDTFGEDAPLITATGTPVSNSLAEMYTMQRYMKYKQMKRDNLHMFDAWAKQFGEVENVYEVAPSGVGYRQSTRFSKFKNLPALMGSYTSFSDIITMQDLKDQSTAAGKVFPVPKLRTGKPINVIAQRSDLQRDFFGVPQLAVNEATGEIQFEIDPNEAGIEVMDNRKWRLSFTGGYADFDNREEAELELVSKSLQPKTFIDPNSLLGKFANLAQLTRETKGKINALSLTGLANKSGLDYRIIDPSAPDFAGSKINTAVTNMVSLWKETAKDKGTQIVFCDMSVPASARASAANKERYALVRDRNNNFVHKSATLHTIEGFDGFPFYIVQSGTKENKVFAVYEPLSGLLVREGFAAKDNAKQYMAELVSNDNGRDRIFEMRDSNEIINKDDIDEYFSNQEKIEIADDEANLITPEDLEAAAGSSSFSVYDDIKAKLLKQGVPENQIAFIHDFNTPKQKEELFKRVNNGDVRFLFGSTPKLGAGTNVQKRLVGLHHIDAPWRPSDLEQREGRIIRQGNELYARDPEGFEISIWRYATEQTYDTRRWQLLEHKAAGIEQLRKYTGEAEIEDVASEASNSADMKAAASGNPLILEETKLRTEKKRLIGLEKSHADSIYAMARKIKQNETSSNGYLADRIKLYEDLIKTTKAYPIPEDKLKIADIVIDGKRVGTKEAAENELAKLALKVRQEFTFDNPPRFIEYRGARFFVKRGNSFDTLGLYAPDGNNMAYFSAEDKVSPSGLITRFNNYIDSFHSRIEDTKAHIEELKIENESLSQRVNDPFEFTDKLKEVQAEHANVQRKLMKSSSLEAIPDNQREEFDRLVKERKEELKSLGYEKALKESEADTMFSRTGSTNQGLNKQVVQKAVNALRANWKNAPEIIVVDDMNDTAIRKAVRDENQRQLSQGAKGQPEGFYDDGKVYILASEMNTPQDVMRVVLHETLGHYGLRGLYGKEIGKVLDRVAMLRKSDLVKKAKQYGLDLTKESDRRIAAEEVLAEMAQTAPSAGFVKSAIAAIRNFLRSIGLKLDLTDNDIIVNYLLPARRFVVNGKGAGGTGGIKLSRDNSVSDAQLFKELTLNDEAFKYSKSDAKDMQEVFDDVIPQLVRIERNLITPEGMKEQYFISPINLDGSANFTDEGKINVYDDGRVEINVLAWGEGKAGSGIYSAVGNWAYNNDKVFAGDRDGITPEGKIRRLENMISLALKFGTTKHIEPHAEQMRELEFDWRKGDDEYNLGQMLKASYNAIRNGIYVTENKGTDFEITYKSKGAVGLAKLDDLIYDFDKQQFTDLSNGNRYSDKEFQALASTARARATHAGSTTIKRAAIAHTFLRAQGAERKRLLELISEFLFQPLENTQLKEIFYSRNPQQNLESDWSAPEASKMDSLIYTLQDKHVDLKRVTQAIKDTGRDISDRWNAYLQEELYHGRTAKRTQDFIKQDLDPLIMEMRMRGVEMADFEEYLWARHAEEYNIQIAKVNPDMQDGGSGMTTQEANDYLDNLSPKDKTAYEALARRIDLINRKSRQVLIDYGLESVSTIAAWEAAYKNYVPLMREDMDAGFGNGTGQGFSVKGNSSKRATGSNRAVVDIIANMAQQYEKNIIRGEKNRVSTALIGLAKLNPNDEFWKVDTPPTIKSISKSTGLVETRTDPNYKNRDNVVVARIVNKLGKIEERSVVFNEFDERSMRMARSIKNLDQDQIGEFLGVASIITRYFASINTQYNPIFGVINITRDVQGALLNLSTTPIADKKKEVLKNTPSALLGIYKDLRSERKTGTAATSKWSTLFEEFQREGGQTGYRDMFKNAKERGEALKNALDPTWWKESKIGKLISVNGAIAKQEQWAFDKAIKPIFDWLSDYNNALENAVRLSVYKVALDNGQSKQQAASIAKNISVNFNRKGQIGRQIGSLYAFFNASVQGTARIGETLLTKDDAGNISLSKTGKRIVQGGLLLGAMQALILAAAGYDEDEPPEFIRDRNIIIPLDMFGADSKYITIPMPLGFNAIPATGRIVTEWALSGGEDTSKRLVHILSMLLDVTNPIGNAGLSVQTFSPTIGDPLVALAENKDFTGRPISREDFNSLNPTAGFTRSRDKAWGLSVGIARGINWATGGTDYKQGVISPTADQLEYLAGQFTGGVGREVIKAGTTIDSLATGEDLPTYKIPLVGRFYGDTTGQSSQGSKFYQNIRDLNEHDNEIKGLRENGGNVKEYLDEYPEARLSRMADLSMREVSSIRKRQRIMKENDASKESIKALDDRITTIMKRLNERVVNAKEKKAA